MQRFGNQNSLRLIVSVGLLSWLAFVFAPQVGQATQGGAQGRAAGTDTITYSVLAIRQKAFAFAGVNLHPTILATSVPQVTTKLSTISTISSSLNPSTFGQAVILSAIVDSQVPQRAPTGTVTFLDRGLFLGAARLINGSATFSISSLSAGSHSLSVVYNGDSNFNSSASALLTQTVRSNVAPCSGATFSAATTYPVGTNPYWLTAASLRNNGNLDLIVANRNSNNLSLLTGNGKGAFQPTGNPVTGMNPTSVAVGDFNGDGNADLAVAHENSSNVAILRGNGDGTFQLAVSYPIKAGTRAIVVGDFNRDGKLDVAVAGANFFSSSLSVFLGNGDGTLQSAATYPAGQNAISLASGDFNGDGRIDLAVANYSANTVSLFLGNGDGTFQAPTNFPVGTNPTSVAVGDFNGDDKFDLAVTNYETHNVSILQGNGNGTFQRAVNYSTGLRPMYVVVGDLNGDGSADLAIANYLSNSVSLLLGKRDGTFDSAQPIPVETAPRSLVVEDFDGDGTLDIAVANEFSNNVALLRNTCGQADLLFAQHVFPDTTMVGQALTYTLKITNLGPGIATSVIVQDDLPISTSFVSCEATNGGVCGGTGSNRTVSLATLAPGATATVTLTVNVTGQLSDGAVISNTASIFSATHDPDTTNNSGSTRVTVKGVAQARLTLDGGKSGFDFSPLVVRPEPPATPPSDAFTVENQGNAPLVLTFSSILRTGMNVDGQRITDADDRKFYSLRAINGDGSETPIGIGSTRSIVNGQPQRFRVLYTPTRPPVGDSTRNLPASLVLQEANSSTLTIAQNGGAPLTINMLGRIDPKAQLISPVRLRRDGNDLIVEASVYDANLNTFLMRYQFLDNANNVVESREVLLTTVLAQSTVIIGQSFIVEQRFPGLASKVNITNVKVTLLDSDGSVDTLISGTTQPITALANVSAASYSEAGIASDAMASGFGTGLATAIQSAAILPLPTTLAGTTVKIKDSLGTERLAPLFFVSPTQVNYLIPSDTALGLAVVTITSSDGKVALGATNIAWVAPSLFSANSDGQGVAAAAIQRVAGDGAQSIEAVAIFDTTQNKFIARPINLGAATEQVYLTLFGTGIRHGSALTAVKAQIGGVDAPVFYAGAQGGYVGLDQVNVLVPRSLIGRGDVEVKLWVDYQPTNTVKIKVQ